MSGTSIFQQSQAGLAGQRSSPALSDIVENGFLDPTNPPLAYGVPVKNVLGKYAKILTSDLASSIIGFLTVPTVDNMPSVLNQPLGTTTPNPAVMHGMIREGKVFVSCLGATAPAAWGGVYVRTADAGSTGRAIGTIEAAPGTLTPTTANGAAKTGGDTIGTLATGAGSQVGDYKLIASDATHYEVFDPSGKFVGRAVAGTAFTTQITFTITTAGATTVPGDSFTYTVTPDCQLIPNVSFTGGRDSANIAEIRIN